VLLCCRGHGTGSGQALANPAAGCSAGPNPGYPCAVADRTSVVPVTLSFLTAGHELLLLQVAAHKDRFARCWNGVGGHVRAGESVRSSALREIREETGLVPCALELRAVVHEVGLLAQPHLLFVFVARLARREEPQPCSEGQLAWFARDALPWPRLVPDLRELLPRVLEGRDLIYGVQHFDGGDRSLRLELEQTRDAGKDPP
jgi:8-oxo-dGTP diphosphatase